MKNIKIHFSTSHCLTLSMFTKYGMEVVQDPFEADVIIAQSWVKHRELINKTVYVTSEPPIVDEIIWCYEHFDDFKLVVAYSRDPKKQNQIERNPPNYPNYIWVRPTTSKIPIVTRRVTKLRTKNTIFLGNVIKRRRLGLPCGAVSINHLRKPLCEFLSKNYVGSKCFGVGLNGQTKRDDDWRVDKLKKIEQTDPDFLLSLENTIMPHYITEKLWDGFFADRVTMYLGDPMIDNYVQRDCYIDLRPFYDIQNDVFNFNRLKEYLNVFDQDMYDNMLFNARKVREKYSLERSNIRDELTLKIINLL